MTTNTTITRAPPFELGSSFYLPEILTRIPVKLHPMLDEVEEHSNAWVRQHLSFAFPNERRLLHFLSFRCAYFACAIWPNTRDAWMLDLANLSQYLFAFDDAYGDRSGIGRDAQTARSVFRDFFAVMAGAPPATGHPYAMNFQDIWARVALPMTAGQRSRHMSATQDFLNECAREVASREKGAVFDFETYMMVRRKSVYSAPCFPIIEHGLGIELPEDLAASDELEELHLACTDCMILINDLFSFPKEALEGDYVNAIPILCIHDNLNLQQSVDRVCELLSDTETQFITRRDALLASQKAPHSIIGPYVMALGDYMGGLLQWARFTTRYHGPDYVWNGLTSGVVTLGKTGTMMRPT